MRERTSKRSLASQIVMATMAGLLGMTFSLMTPRPIQAGARVGIAGDQFTLNGKKTFLLGTSYFDGMYWRGNDLQNLHDRGFNLVRVWLDWWTLSHYNNQGTLTSAGKSSLLGLVRKANSLDMVVDIAILDNVLSFGGDSAQKRENAVRSVVRALKNEPNVIYDLFNEHKNFAGPHKCGGERINLSDAEVKHLVQVAQSEDIDVLITASAAQDYRTTGWYFLDSSVLRSYNKANIRDLTNTGVNFLAPHFQRNSVWATDTGIRVQRVGNYAASIGKSMPVYVQEDMRRGGGVFCQTDSEPTALQEKSDFLLAAKRAYDGGAAGWVFHTSAGFNLDQQSYFNAMDSVEKAIVNELAGHLGLPGGGGGGGDTSNGLVLDDSLQGSTKGTRHGGIFTSGGWKTTTSSSDQIVYHLANTLSNGAIEVDIKNFDPLNQCVVNKNDFIALYGQSDGRPGVATQTGTSVIYIRAGTNYIENGKANLKSNASGSTESLMSNVPVFDPSRTYAFRIEWQNGNVKWLLDGKELRSASTDPMKINYVFIGSDDLGGSCPGYVLSNVRVYGDASGGGGDEPPPPASDGNIIASSSQTGNGPEDSMDGNLSTRWATNGNGEWIRYDLGSIKSIGKIKIAWYNGDSRKYTFDVQVSDNGSNWQTVLNREISSGTTSQLETYSMNNASGRYVRIVGHGSTANNWISIREVDFVTGASEPPPPASGGDIIASSSQSGNGPEDSMDGNLSTRWATKGNGEWIRYDLGSSTSIDKIKIAWYNGASRKYTFDVQVSDNGSNWQTVLNRKMSSGTTSQLETYSMNNASGRYVRIVGHGNTDNNWISIREVVIVK